MRVASELGYSVAAVIWIAELFRGAPAPMVAALYGRHAFLVTATLLLGDLPGEPSTSSLGGLRAPTSATSPSAQPLLTALQAALERARSQLVAAPATAGTAAPAGPADRRNTHAPMAARTAMVQVVLLEDVFRALRPTNSGDHATVGSTSAAGAPPTAGPVRHPRTGRSGQ